MRKVQPSDNGAVTCPLCGERRARRTCPALGQQICTVCCGTKRLVQIQCPSNCTYLASAREHPPAAAVRQQQLDLGLLVQFMRDLSERQAQFFFLVTTFLLRYESPELQPLIDDDAAEAAAALAGTFETASRGLIYDHRPASLPAGRLVTALKPLIEEAGKDCGTAFQWDAAVVLRRIEEAARQVRIADPSNRRAFFDLLERIARTSDERPRSAERPDPAVGAAGKAEGREEPSRLIVP